MNLASEALIFTLGQSKPMGLNSFLKLFKLGPSLTEISAGYTMKWCCQSSPFLSCPWSETRPSPPSICTTLKGKDKVKRTHWTLQHSHITTYLPSAAWKEPWTSPLLARSCLRFLDVVFSGNTFRPPSLSVGRLTHTAGGTGRHHSHGMSLFHRGPWWLIPKGTKWPIFRLIHKVYIYIYIYIYMYTHTITYIFKYIYIHIYIWFWFFSFIFFCFSFSLLSFPSNLLV